MARYGRRAACLLLATVAGVATVSTAPAAAAAAAKVTRAWDVLATSNPTTNNVVLSAVDCSSNTSCLAVGYREQQDLPGRIKPSVGIAELWDGTSWTLLSPTAPGSKWHLTGVSCDPSGCMVVGWRTYLDEDGWDVFEPTAERYAGGSWTVVSPSGSGYFNAVSCSSATACTAVGSTVQRWNGTSWTEQSIPGNARSSVSCPAPTYCFAVGQPYDGGPVAAAQWNGLTWSTVPVPEPAGATASNLRGVDCVSAANCRAVGYSATSGQLSPLVESWNGTALALEPVPAPPGATIAHLDGVSCPSATFCRAVGSATDAFGDDQPLAVAFDGGAWSLQEVDDPVNARDAGLAAVACRTQTRCEAVGTRGPRAGSTLAMAYGSSGTSWTQQSTPVASDHFGTMLNGISCTTAQYCVAVGELPDGPMPAGLEWDGSAWSLLKAALPKPRIGAYTGVSCTGSLPCVVPGYRGGGSLTGRLVDGAIEYHEPVREAYGPLAGVSCLASTAFCMTVGYRLNGSRTEAISYSYNGDRWTEQPVALHPNVSYNLAAVSCVSASRCVAVGRKVSDAERPLALVWDGTSWHESSPTPPAGALASSLSGLSCSGVNTCVAVGYSEVGNNALIYKWNGVSWQRQTLQLPAGTKQPLLRGVDCPSSQCLAVGSVVNRGRRVPFSATSGSTWSGALAGRPSRAVSGTLNGVDCIGGITNCFAAGGWQDSAGVGWALTEHYH